VNIAAVKEKYEEIKENYDDGKKYMESEQIK